MTENNNHGDVGTEAEIDEVQVKARIDKAIAQDKAFFDEMRSELHLARKAFQTSHNLNDDEKTGLRSEEDAGALLTLVESVTKLYRNLFYRYPTLIPFFDKEFKNIKDFYHRGPLLEILYVEDYLFPESQSFSFLVDEKFNLAFAQTHLESLEHWLKDKEEKHKQSQDTIRNKFDLKIKFTNLPCQCDGCLGDYRGKVRDTIYKEQEKLVFALADELGKNLDDYSIDQLADQVYDLKKTLDKNLHNVRYLLKRGSLSKLENETKKLFRDNFSYQSALGKQFGEKIIHFFKQLLLKQNLRRDFVSDQEYERFFLQIDTSIWRSESFLKKEFERLVKSVLALKRKDISANILCEYLGQFWLHAEARAIKRKVVYHMGPTNSGKTYHAIEALCSVKKGCYLAPLRLLASELFDTMNNKGVKTTLLTGEEVIEVEGASHYASTIEMAKLHERYDCCVIDEIQMITDSQRGWAWTRALVNVFADEVHICGDPSVYELVKKILELTGDTLEVRNYNRMTELQVEAAPITLSSLQKGDALIVFSRRNALKYKGDLENLDFKVSIVYGMLSPEVRREQARKFDQGETDIIVSTDAISMGMNLPVRRIVFSAFSKFIDNKEYPLSHSEIKQISGRAGRFNRFPTGFVTCLTREKQGVQRLHDALQATLSQNEKAMVGPDLEIFNQVNHALKSNGLPILKLSEFLRLFNTMTFVKPFYCVDLKEMIELAEIVEEANDDKNALTPSEIFGFACAPVNLGLMDHVQYYVWILNHYVNSHPIINEGIDFTSDNIDYLETAIKCVELYQWLARHFSNKNFSFDQNELLSNKTKAIERLNELLSEKTVRACSSCGCKLPPNWEYNICDECFGQRRFSRRNNFRNGPAGTNDRAGSNRDKPFDPNERLQREVSARSKRRPNFNSADRYKQAERSKDSGRPQLGASKDEGRSPSGGKKDFSARKRHGGGGTQFKKGQQKSRGGRDSSRS